MCRVTESGSVINHDRTRHHPCVLDTKQQAKIVREKNSTTHRNHAATARGPRLRRKDCDYG